MCRVVGSPLRTSRRVDPYRKALSRSLVFVARTRLRYDLDLFSALCISLVYTWILPKPADCHCLILVPNSSGAYIIVYYLTVSASVAQLDAPSDWRPGGRGFNPRRGRQHSFVEIDHEIFSTVILSLPLIQEGQLSVSGERMCTTLVNRLED